MELAASDSRLTNICPVPPKRDGAVFYTGRLSGLGLRPSGFDPTRRVQRSGLKKNEITRIKEIVFSSDCETALGKSGP